MDGEYSPEIHHQFTEWNEDDSSSGEETWFGDPFLPKTNDRPLEGRVTQKDRYPFAGGGNSNIYRGTLARSDGRKIWVAIKVIRVHVSDEDSTDVLRRLHREVSVWRRLKHQNVLPFIGVCGDVAPLPVLISPFYNFGHIGTYLKKYPGADRSDLLCGVASGMEYLHENDVVHGDLKPHNVLVDKRGVPCICDFGISKILDLRGFTTASVGTAPYMAPELFFVLDEEDQEEKSPLTTKSSDMYSFGLLALELLTSEPPKGRHSRPIATVQIIHGLHPKRADYASETVTDEMWSILDQCWALEPQLRPSMPDILPLLRQQSSRSQSPASNSSNRTADSEEKDSVPLPEFSLSKDSFQSPRIVDPVYHRLPDVAAGMTHDDWRDIDRSDKENLASTGQDAEDETEMFIKAPRVTYENLPPLASVRPGGLSMLFKPPLPSEVGPETGEPLNRSSTTHPAVTNGMGSTPSIQTEPPDGYPKHAHSRLARKDYAMEMRLSVSLVQETLRALAERNAHANQGGEDCEETQWQRFLTCNEWGAIPSASSDEEPADTLAVSDPGCHPAPPPPSLSTSPLARRLSDDVPTPARPSTPHTTRQQMLHNEMSQSLLHNVLWLRELSRTDVTGPPPQRKRSIRNVDGASTVPEGSGGRQPEKSLVRLTPRAPGQASPRGLPPAPMVEAPTPKKFTRTLELRWANV